MSPRPWVVIAGGGTAGHVVPALAIGRALAARGHDPSTVRFVGSKRGVEGRMVTAAGFPVTLLPGRGLARRLTVENVGALVGFVSAFVQAFVLLARWRPKVVVSMGGYASAPCAVAAALLRIPVVVSEQNALPTATHRMVGRVAVASAVPFEGTPLPRAVVTGNPVRSEVLALDPSPAGRAEARANLGLPLQGVLIAATGGSLGARTINEAVAGLCARWPGPQPIVVHHVVGRRDWEWASAQPPSANPLVDHRLVEYEERMPELLAAADLVISRAGGSIVSELAVVGRASVLVPLPIAPYDHQAFNARVLERAGGAVMLRDHDVTAERLIAEIVPLVEEPGKLDAMGTAARTEGRPDAADRVADVVELHARP